MSGSTGFDPSKLWAFITGSGSSGGMPAVGTETLTDAWKGYQAGALGQPALNQASNPDFSTGYAAGAAPWNPSATGGGASSTGLATALGGAAKAAGAGQPAAAAPAKLGAPALGQAPLGQPRSAQSLTPLLQLLAQRRDALMPGSATSGQPQGARPTVGLLGF